MIVHIYGDDNNTEIVQGDPGQVIIVIEFDSIEIAKNWFNSAEFQKAEAFRLASTKGWMVLTEEISIPN